MVPIRRKVFLDTKRGQDHDTKPDKATTAQEKTIKIEMYFSKTELLREPTDGSTDVRRSFLKKSSKISSRDHLTIPILQKRRDVRSDQRTGRTVIWGLFKADLGTTAIPMLRAWKSEIQIGLTGVENTRKAAWIRAKELYKFARTYQREGEEPLDQVLMPKRERQGELIGFRRLCTYDEQGGPRA